MFSKYERPTANLVTVETVDIITASVDDTADMLTTWGKIIRNYSTEEVDLFK